MSPLLPDDEVDGALNNNNLAPCEGRATRYRHLVGSYRLQSWMASARLS